MFYGFTFCNVIAQNSEIESSEDKVQRLDYTELRPWHSAITNRDYLLYIAYPPSYGKNPEQSYPVVFLTDAYWSFNLMATISPTLWQDQLVPEYILVGIGYADKSLDYNKERFFELTPNKERSEWANKQDFKMGGASLFLKAIKEELFPYTEKNLRADATNRVLVGASLGGLFGLYTLYQAPNLFNGYVMASPWVLWDGNWPVKHVKALNAKHQSKIRWYMGVTEFDKLRLQDGIKALHEMVLNQPNPSLEYKFNLVEGMGHSSGCIEIFSKGLCFVFNMAK